MTKGKNFSANNVSGKRKANDFYETPYSMTRHLLDNVAFDKSLNVLEPACGGGAIVRVLKEHWQDNLISAYDIERDFLKETSQWDYIITNPPFSLAGDFVKVAKKVAKKKFAMLLPLNYLHGKKRFNEIYSDKEYPLSQVNVFVSYAMLGEKLREDGKYGTGMIVYAWYVWDREHKGNPEINWFDNSSDLISKKT